MNTKEFMNMDIHKDKVVDLEIAGKKYPVTIKGDIDESDIYAAAEIGRNFCFVDGVYDASREHLANYYCLIKIFTDIEIDDDDAESVVGFTNLADNFNVEKFILDNLDNKHAYYVITNAYSSALTDALRRRNSVFGIIDEIKGLDLRGMLGDDVINAMSKISNLDDDNIIKGILEYRGAKNGDD